MDDFVEKLRQAYTTRFNRNASTRVRCPGIPAMAAFIRQQWPYLQVRVEPWSEVKDTHPKGVRWRIPGKRDYHGRCLTVTHCGRTLLRHKTTETYRHNTDVAGWILDRLKVKKF